MDSWDVALLFVAGYFAVMALIRLMIQRRDQLVLDLHARMAAEKAAAAKAADDESSADPFP